MTTRLTARRAAALACAALAGCASAAAYDAVDRASNAPVPGTQMNVDTSGAGSGRERILRPGSVRHAPHLWAHGPAARCWS